MSDKFRTSFPIAISFANGEQPTAKKINAIATQSKNGLALIERAIGDLWNQSGDSVTSSYPNKITNIARAIGDASLISSSMQSPDFTGVTSVRVAQVVVRAQVEIKLDYIPVNDSTLDASIQALHGASGAYTGSSVTNTSVTTANLWHLNTASYKVQLGSPIHATNGLSYIEYNVLAADFPSDVSSEGSFNLIPNVNQTDWDGIKIVATGTANKYLLVLPFRRPLSTMGSKAPSSALLNIATSSTIRFYGPVEGYTPVSGITDVDFYRYTLPEIILDLFTTPVAGQTIPAGLIYLWNNSTQTLVEGLTFKVPEIPITMFGQVPWVVQVEGTILDSLFTGLASNAAVLADDTAASYKSDFSLIAAGQSLAGLVSKLKDELTSGSKSVGIQKIISHNDLKETQPVVSTRHSVGFPNTFIEGDGHAHLFSRRGSQLTSSTSLQRDAYNNAIVGNVLISNTSSSNNYQGTTGNSFALYFGTAGPLGAKLRGDFNKRDTEFGTSWGTVLESSHTLDVESPFFVLNAASSLEFNQVLKATDELALGQFNGEGIFGGSFWTQRLVLNGTTRSAELFDGSSTDTAGSTRYIDINATGDNLFRFKGANLDFSATDSSLVVIGNNNSNTHLRLKNNVLEFGASGENITHSSITDTFTFTGNIDVKSTSGSSNVPLVPSRIKTSTAGDNYSTPAWSQSSEFTAGTASSLSPRIKIPTHGSASKDWRDWLYFPIPSIPLGAVISTITVIGTGDDIAGTPQLRGGITASTTLNSGSNIGTSSAIVDEGADTSSTTYTITLGATYTVTSEPTFVTLGVITTAGIPDERMELKIRSIQVQYTYTALRI